jgi:hypothetical protein
LRIDWLESQQPIESLMALLSNAEGAAENSVFNLVEAHAFNRQITVQSLKVI